MSEPLKAKWDKITETEYRVFVSSEDDCVVLECSSVGACLNIIQALTTDADNVMEII